MLITIYQTLLHENMTTTTTTNNVINSIDIDLSPMNIVPSPINKVPSTGKHWERIGFQGNDPRTDLNRSMKMLSILQVNLLQLFMLFVLLLLLLLLLLLPTSTAYFFFKLCHNKFIHIYIYSFYIS